MKKLAITLSSMTIIMLAIVCFGGNYKKVNKSVRVELDFLDENTSKPDVLYWGSEVGLSAKVSYNTGIKWSISNDGSKDIEVSTTEYCNSQGDNCIEVYAPFGYCDELTITAAAEEDAEILDTYSLRVEDGTKWNGTTFFEFDMNVPDDKQLEGDIPKVKEKWNVDAQEYSIILPSVSCRVDGYMFSGWKDKNGRIYQPNETLAVTHTGEGVYYIIRAEWKKIRK